MPETNMTLPDAWEKQVLPEIDHIAESTLKEYRSSLGLWKTLTGNPTCDQINRETVRHFRDKLISTPYRRGGQKKVGQRTPSTVNRVMRDIHVTISPLWPADRSNPSGLNLIPYFKWPRNLQHQKQLPFVFTAADLDRLYLNCNAARQPSKFARWCPMNEPRLWRLALVLALNCGARTWDLFDFKISKIRLNEPEPYQFGSISFHAQKTGKLHRFPLNECAAKHLKAYLADPITWHGQTDRLFPGFYKGQTFYKTWKRICTAAESSGTFESMRKTCVTRHNSVVWNAGFWLSGHVQTGVFGHYDNPSDRIFEAVYGLEQPAEFVRGAAALGV
ncbi:tyrosine-type recombinase/integrase [Schlesneria sp. DSM 10557]|uniref:tyrosine-type recombinase/integrase n=1 Tax=Schlesneria sp. DSM 10557 TaxID=3044399 RepID=UPI00359FCD33